MKGWLRAFEAWAVFKLIGLILSVAMARLAWKKGMKMKQLFKAPLGSAGSVEMDIQDDGRASIEASYVEPNSGIEVDLKIVGSPKPALEHLKVVIPGTIDDLVIDAAESYLGLK